MPYLGFTPEGDFKRLRLLSMALRIGSFGYFVQDMTTLKITWAPETYRIWGVEPDPSILTRDWILNSVHPEDREKVMGWQTYSSWTEKIIDFRILRPNGEVRYLRSHVEQQRNADGTGRMIYGIMLDDSERRRTEVALERSESRFESLFETSGAGIVITSARARILFINKAFANLLGYEPHELLGTSIRDLSPPDTADATLTMVEEMRAGPNRTRDVEKPYRHRNGDLIWTRLTINMHVTADGVEQFIGVVQDLTERYRAEQRLRDSERLLNVAQGIGNIGHWVWWPDTGMSEWSEELCNIIGSPISQRFSYTQRMINQVHPDDVPLFSASYEKLLSLNIPQSIEFRIVRRDGIVRNVIGRSMPAENTPQGRRMIGTIQDITESKRREAALRRESVKAEAANLAKTLFLANMSHELRTPLNAILGFAQLLAMETKGALNPDQKSYVENVVRGGEHLLRLINDVLDLARIDSGHFPLAIVPVNLARVCRDVLGSFIQIASERSVSLSSNCDETPGRDEIEFTATADPMRVTQVLMNLVSNAIKYNRHGGQVTIKISALNDTMIRLAVSDTGLGIPLDKQAEVFQHFNRLGAETRAVEGTGIGLALSKRLIEEMDGTIGFESQPNARTTFWFDLPRSASADLRTGLDDGVATFLHAAQ